MKVKLMDFMGSDLTVVNAARVSFGKEADWIYKYPNSDSEWDGLAEEGWEPVNNTNCLEWKKLSKADESLIAFLARGCTSGDWESLIKKSELVGQRSKGGLQEHKDVEDLMNYIKSMPSHWTPFGHCQVSLHFKVPLFVARQIHKHQTGFVVNEVSRRYVTDTPEFYVPNKWRKAADNVKQGSLDEPLDIEGKRVCLLCKNTIKLVSPSNMKKQKFCSVKCQQKYYRSHTNDGWASSKICSLKQSAKKRKLEFSITKDDILEIGLPIKCKYLELELDYSSDKIVSNSPSVNRINNEKGYIKGNIEIISNMANSMLLNSSERELMLFIKNVSLERFGTIHNSSNSVDEFYKNMKTLYKELINSGLSAEHVRMLMPQSQYTEFWMTGSLYGFANMYKQRSDTHAQREVQEVAKQIGEIIEPLFPISWVNLTK